MVKHIQLSKGKVALVDDKDYEVLSKHKWFALNGKYAARTVWDGKAKKKTTILLHRQILDEPIGLDVDHINLNTFDNRRDNLRAITHQQNCFNRPGLQGHSNYKGVSRVWNGNWAAKITISENTIPLGTYTSEIDAAKAYNIGALNYMREVATLNEVNHEGFQLKIKTKSSRYKGVSFKKGMGKWVTYVNVDKRKTYLGSFTSEEDAARMYNFWAYDIYGENTRLNIITD